MFTGNWSKAWQGVVDVFGGIFDGLVGLIKVPLNYIIDAINCVVRGLNSLSVDIPDWVPGVGGETWGISIPQIPKLATGGITDVNNPFMAIVGDNKTQREVVAPLDDLMGMVTGAVSTSMMQYNNNSGSNNSSERGDVVIMVNDLELGRASINCINKAQRIEGRTLLNI